MYTSSLFNKAKPQRYCGIMVAQDGTSCTMGENNPLARMYSCRKSLIPNGLANRALLVGKKGFSGLWKRPFGLFEKPFPQSQRAFFAKQQCFLHEASVPKQFLHSRQNTLPHCRHQQ